MRASDLLAFALSALRGFRMRTLLMLLAMAIAVAAVVVLTALGEGARRYVIDQFSSLGTNLLIVLPGRSETTGGPPPLLGTTPRDLTLADALALNREPAVRRVAPVSLGNVEVSVGARSREATIIGTTTEFQQVRQIEMARGRFIQTPEPTRASAECVIGRKIYREMFGNRPGLGEWLRLADRRCRLVGVLASEAHSLGMAMDEIVVVPVAFALTLFDSESLFRVLVEVRSREQIAAAREAVIHMIRVRHDGEDDVTVIAQDSVLSTFDRILRTLTYAVAGIAAISLVVAGVLVMNVMLIAVTQRTAEVGLLKALGSSPTLITRLFVTEAILLAGLGATIGLAAGYLAVAVLRGLYPQIPFAVPLWAALASVMVALATGVFFGLLPARRAARLDPVVALARR